MHTMPRTEHIDEQRPLMALHKTGNPPEKHQHITLGNKKINILEFKTHTQIFFLHEI
jgi:hypothetical protein